MISQRSIPSKRTTCVCSQGLSAHGTGHTHTHTHTCGKQTGDAGTDASVNTQPGAGPQMTAACTAALLIRDEMERGPPRPRRGPERDCRATPAKVNTLPTPPPLPRNPPSVRSKHRTYACPNPDERRTRRTHRADLRGPSPRTPSTPFRPNANGDGAPLPRGRTNRAFTATAHMPPVSSPSRQARLQEKRNPSLSPNDPALKGNHQLIVGSESLGIQRGPASDMEQT